MRVPFPAARTIAIGDVSGIKGFTFFCHGTFVVKMFELLAGCDKEENLANAPERCIRKEAGSSPTMMETVFLN
jgi:hypothetical protein